MYVRKESSKLNMYSARTPHQPHNLTESPNRRQRRFHHPTNFPIQQGSPHFATTAFPTPGSHNFSQLLSSLLVRWVILARHILDHPSLLQRVMQYFLNGFVCFKQRLQIGTAVGQ
jgi:hypothetical protein